MEVIDAFLKLTKEVIADNNFELYLYILIAVLCALGAVLHGAYGFCHILPLALFSIVFTSHV